MRTWPPSANGGRRGLQLLAAGAALLFLLTACGSDDSPDDNGTSSNVTKPGTKRKLGESATVEYSIAAGEGTATITVMAFQQGKSEDLANFNLDAEDKAKTPWFVKYTVKNNGPVDAGPATLGTSVVAVDSDGKALRRMILIGAFPQCESTLSDGAFPGGTTKETCDVVLVPAGTTVAEVRYTSLTGPYARAPITWKN